MAVTESDTRSKRSRAESTGGVLGDAGVVGADVVATVEVPADVAFSAGLRSRKYQPANPPPPSSTRLMKATRPGGPSLLRGASAGARARDGWALRGGGGGGGSGLTGAVSRERGVSPSGLDSRASVSPMSYPPAASSGRSESALGGGFICVSRRPPGPLSAAGG